MKPALSVFAALALLAACKPEAAVETAPAGTAAMQTAAVDQAAAAPVPPPTGAVKPSFECGKASSEIEQLICSNYSLAAFDNRMAEIYAAELAKPGAAKDLAVMQRGWLKGRDECWKAQDQLQCVTEEYLSRIAYLQINSPGQLAATAIAFDCNDNSNPLYIAYYNNLENRPAVITMGNDQAMIFPQPAASGAKYGRTGILFWEHQGIAEVDFFGIKLECKPLPAATSNL